jgi:hypothetical protein
MIKISQKPDFKNNFLIKRDFNMAIENLKSLKRLRPHKNISN